MPDLLELVDPLYAIPATEFTATRDALVAALRADPATRDLAARVKALRKPSTAAWVLNHLVRRESEQVTQILSVAEALRGAQQAMDGDELRALTKQRRQLTAAVTTRARALAAEVGHPVSGAVAEQVEATLTAALLDSGAADALRSGLLVQGLAAVGMTATDAVAAVAVPEALGHRSAAAPVADLRLRVVKDPGADQRTLARERTRLAATLEAAERALDQARSTDESRRSKVAILQAEVLHHQAEADELRRRLSSIEETVERLDDDIADAEEEAADAVESTRAAERDQQAAAAALAAFDQAHGSAR